MIKLSFFIICVSLSHTPSGFEKQKLDPNYFLLSFWQVLAVCDAQVLQQTGWVEDCHC